MTLSPGTRLGPYEIVAGIGAGGMGEVYRARDTRLDRAVAIKVLPEDAARDPDRLRRFEQEARAVSALNHPHICTLYDIGWACPSTDAAEEIPFLVMELLEGRTLKQELDERRRAASGARAIAVKEALAYGRQMADALDAAHRRGIIHRDLKPANIKVRPDRSGEGSGLRPRNGTGRRGCIELGRDEQTGRASATCPERSRRVPAPSPTGLPARTTAFGL